MGNAPAMGAGGPLDALFSLAHALYTHAEDKWPTKLYHTCAAITMNRGASCIACRERRLLWIDFILFAYLWLVMGSSILKVGSNLTVWFRTVHEYFEKKKTLLSSRLESLRERFELSIRTLRNVSGTCKYNRTLTIYRFESFMITYFNREFSIRCECVICFRWELPMYKYSTLHVVNFSAM